MRVTKTLLTWKLGMTFGYAVAHRDELTILRRSNQRSEKGQTQVRPETTYLYRFSGTAISGSQYFRIGHETG
jgi:hypothetical protein